jgi:glycosyltransferase involved in cell wall biosynthesis
MTMVHKKKIKIVHYIQDLEPGGAERMLVDLIRFLPPDRFEQILATRTDRGALFKIFPGDRARHVRVRSVLSLYRMLRREKPDIFHSHLWRADLAGIPAARAAGIPHCFSTRHNLNYFSGWKCPLILWDAWIMRGAEAVVANSEATRRHCESFSLYRGVRFRVISNGIDLDVYTPAGSEGARSGPGELLTVASLTEQKGHLDFLDVLARLEYREIRWHCVGSGPLEEKIRRKAGRLGLEQRVVFHGSRTDPVPFYRDAGLFVLPSRWEGFGLVVVEAMAAGVPVFASRVDGIAEILEDGKTGVLCNVRDPESAARKLQSLLEDAPFRERIRRAARNASKRYSILRTAAAYAQMYEESLGRREA